MKYLLLPIIFILFLTIHPLTFAMTPSNFPSTFYCVGNNPQPPCVTIPPSLTISPFMSQSPSNALSSNPSIPNSPSTSPFPESKASPSPVSTGTPGNGNGQFCANFSQLLNNFISTQSQSVSDKVHIKCGSSGDYKKGNNGDGNTSINPNNGWLSKFIAFLLQLILQILQLCGNQVPALTPTPSTAPSSGAGTGGGGISATPSSVISIPAPTIYGTSPAPSAAPSAAPPSSPSTSNLKPVGISGNWALVFDDEFNGSSLNTTYWSTNIEKGDNTENNVKVSASNVSVSGGDLILTLSSSSLGANVSTDPSQGIKGFQFGVGYVVEGRIYFPGNGTDIYNWPAFWTVNNNWPSGGEIDIAEGNSTLTSNYHSSAGAQNYNIPGTWSNGWHTYAVDRESGINYIYWDGKLVKQYNTSDGGALHYITINVGNITGPDCNCGDTPIYGTGSEVKVDYVRVWKKQ